MDINQFGPSIQFATTRKFLCHFGLALFLLLCIVIFSSHGLNFSFAETNGTKHMVYGCQKYDTVTHCDRLLDDFVSSKFSANSSKLYAITDTPKIVTGKISGALEMDASRIESVDYREFSTSEYF